jgi:glyoxylase-like metal-dependent hydrolase (beta-lactamase superfamily II)
MQPIELGNMRVHKVYEMDSAMPLSPQLPGLTREDIAKMRAFYDEPGEVFDDPEDCMLNLAFHSWVIEVGGLTVLVDACNGNDKNRSIVDIVHKMNRPYLQNLKTAGFEPDDIDMVMCTHMHFDHVGWNTRLENGKWVPTFRNAKYLFGKRDYDYFLANPPGEEIHQESFLDSIVPVMDAGQGELIDGDHVAHAEIGKGVWIEAAHGHSPGNYVVNARDGGAAGLFWGDVIHHPVQLVRPDVPFAFDHDIEAASRVRRALLSRAADSDTMCFPAHFQRCSAGRVHRDGEAYRYEWAQD